MIYRFRSAIEPLPPKKRSERITYTVGKTKFSYIDKKRTVWAFGRFGGAFDAAGLDMGDLPAPDIDNPRARFYFTEAGFHKYGAVIIEDARRRGLVLRVEKQKNPSKSQIVYQDKWQVAILPEKRK